MNQLASGFGASTGTPLLVPAFLSLVMSSEVWVEKCDAFGLLSAGAIGADWDKAVAQAANTPRAAHMLVTNSFPIEPLIEHRSAPTLRPHYAAQMNAWTMTYVCRATILLRIPFNSGGRTFPTARMSSCHSAQHQLQARAGKQHPQQPRRCEPKLRGSGAAPDRDCPVRCRPL